MVSVILRWVETMIHLGSFSNDQMTSLGAIRFSHLGQHSLRGSTVGGGCTLGSSSSVSSRSGTVSGSGTSKTENQLLSGSGGVMQTSAGLAQATQQGIRNSLSVGCHPPMGLLSKTFSNSPMSI